jgi:hypothetical protein
VFLRSVVFGFFAFLTSFGNACADITIERVPIDNSVPVLLLKGEFSKSDNPELLAREVAASGARVITFDSNGGHVLSAMAYGRMIRSLGLSTLQLRSSQCASACALAFVGGVNREADPGAIGVHQSSFSPESNIEGNAAVAAVQAMTAEIMTYLIEMDVDPKLLQLSLSVPSDDMRYLTAKEMQNYKVTWGSLPALPERAASPGAAPTTVPPSANAEFAPLTIEQRALVFVTAYYSAWSHGNAEAVVFMEEAYADTVDFYGKPTPKAVVIGEKRDFASRWPIRAYSIKPGSARITCSETCRIDGVVDWYAKRDVGDRVSSGTAEFSLVWDQRAGTIISETGKVIETDKGASQPIRLISQWQEQNTTCRGGSGDSAETLAACNKREAIGTKLQAVGWCYGREGEYGYQMEWHACDVASSQENGAVAATSAATKVKRPNASDFPIQSRFTGKTVLPDFKGRDRDFNNFRTRIREGMREGPNFAGRYTLIQIGCGTGCSFVIVANNQTGRPGSFPRGGEDNLYLNLEYSRDSRLVATQWLNYDVNKCFVEFFDFDGNTWKSISKTEIGDTEVCYKPIEENLR